MMTFRTVVKLMAALCVILSGAALGQDTQGLVAHWTFDEGKGNIARDSVGDSHAAIQGGAKFRRFGKGYALSLDGVDDYVDCGKSASLNIEEAGTMVLWFKPAAVQGGLFSCTTGGGWADLRLLLGFKNYGGEEAFLYCLADGKAHSYAHMPMPRMNVWSQAAVTVAGRNVRIYRDGILIASRRLGFTPKFGDVPLLLGKHQGLGDDFFKGLLDDVRVYNRALPQSEIIALCKAQAKARGMGMDAFAKPKLAVTTYPLSGRMLVGIDYQLMWPVPKGAYFDVMLESHRAAKPIAQVHVSASESRANVEAILDLQREPPGPINLHVQARRADRSPLGKAATQTVQWPERDPMFSPKKGIKILNNFVFELLNVESPGAKEFTVHNPREGWLYVAIAKPGGRIPGIAGAIPTAIVDSRKFALRPVGDKLETMRYLPAGPHKVKVGGGVKAEKLIVRAIPELFYDMYGANPLVPETGNYTWAWLRKHVLDHYNCITGKQDFEKQQEEIEEWTSQGGRWHTQRGLPWVKTADEAYEYWAREPGFAHPLMQGIWADEFSYGDKYKKMYPIWCAALRRIAADPKFKGRKFYAYMGMTYRSGYDQLTKTIMECGFRLAPEWYLREQPTEEQAMGHMSPPYERSNRERYDAAYPGAGMNRVVILGLLSQPEESCDIYPDVNYNVHLDMQLHLMAADPAFFGTRGLQGYYSPYVGEEQTRLFARLLRHYAIEGRTDRMLKDPYILTHLDNPDFTDGLKGWTLSPAKEGGIAAKTAEHFGWLQGRYWRKDVGDTVLWTKRDARKPNVFSQEIKNLQPGRLYSLRFFTGNYQDYLNFKSRNYKHATSVKIENVDLIPAKSFQALIRSCYAHTYKKFTRSNPYRMNYYQRVFRAKGTTAGLVLSDWASNAKPGGAPGAELIWNFIQVQPYFPE